jgi:hypothetical protein
VSDADIQVASNEASERETAYLLKSDLMRQRLLAALERASGVSLDDAVAKLGY